MQHQNFNIFDTAPSRLSTSNQGTSTSSDNASMLGPHSTILYIPIKCPPVNRLSISDVAVDTRAASVATRQQHGLIHIRSCNEFTFTVHTQFGVRI